MMRHEFDEILSQLGGDPSEYNDEMYETINRVYLVCDAFDTKADICNFVLHLGYEKVRRLDRQYTKRQREIDDLRNQNSTLLAKIMRIFKESILTNDKAMRTMAINFLKEEESNDKTGINA